MRKLLTPATAAAAVAALALQPTSVTAGSGNSCSSPTTLNLVFPTFAKAYPRLAAGRAVRPKVRQRDYDKRRINFDGAYLSRVGSTMPRSYEVTVFAAIDTRYYKFCGPMRWNPRTAHKSRSVNSGRAADVRFKRQDGVGRTGPVFTVKVARKG